jgi:hypothetical protein
MWNQKFPKYEAMPDGKPKSMTPEVAFKAALANVKQI